MAQESGPPQSAVGGSYAGPLNFLRFPYTRELAGVELAVLGIPYDLATTNRPGARFGPRALREQSAFVGEYPWGVWPWEFDVRERFSVVDYGDVDFNVGYCARMRPVTDPCRWCTWMRIPILGNRRITTTAPCSITLPKRASWIPPIRSR